jgi:hypothetical protein
MTFDIQIYNALFNLDSQTSMSKTSRKQTRFGNTALVLLGLGTALAATVPWTDAMAQDTGAQRRSALVITSDPLPESLRKKVYSKPARARDIPVSEVTAPLTGEAPMETLVGKKVVDLNADLTNLQGKVSTLLTTLDSMQRDNQNKAAEYYAAVATVNTQLQSGTTPGNPRLVKKLETAESNLETLATSVGQMNQLSVEAANASSEASFLQEEVRAAYSLSGAVEEDHIQLAQTEDAIHNTVVILERVLNNVSDDITRTNSYLSSERDNLRALSVAVKNGDLYGKALANRPFSSAGRFMQASASPQDIQGAAVSTPAMLSGPRPLVKIRFDRADVEYEQPVYMAINEALQRYPNARFDLVAVHPTQGNAAEVAIESTKARRNAERVLRTLTEMGLPLDRIDLSYGESADAKTNEVHLFIR